jgi:hypothetical protein
VRKIIREWGALSEARQDGSLASTSYLADPITKKHMDNDALILGFNSAYE